MILKCSHLANQERTRKRNRLMNTNELLVRNFVSMTFQISKMSSTSVVLSSSVISFDWYNDIEHLINNHVGVHNHEATQCCNPQGPLEALVALEECDLLYHAHKSCHAISMKTLPWASLLP